MLKAYQRRYNNSTWFSMLNGSQEIYDLKAVKAPATVAQLVEQLICNQPVGGSNPSGGSTTLNV